MSGGIPLHQKNNNILFKMDSKITGNLAICTQQQSDTSFTIVLWQNIQKCMLPTPFSHDNYQDDAYGDALYDTHDETAPVGLHQRNSGMRE